MLHFIVYLQWLVLPETDKNLIHSSSIMKYVEIFSHRQQL